MKTYTQTYIHSTEGKTKMRHIENRKTGSSIVETAAGLILLIPIVLFLVDVAAMVVAQTENDKLAKACARAAAEFPSGAGAGAATQVFNNQPQSNLLKNKAITFPGAPTGMVTVHTVITCTLPVPVPFIGTGAVDFQAQATEPVVGELP